MTDYAEWLMVVIGHRGVMVNLADAAFLGAHAAGEVAEVVNTQWDIRIHAFRGSVCRYPPTFLQ